MDAPLTANSVYDIEMTVQNPPYITNNKGFDILIMEMNSNTILEYKRVDAFTSAGLRT